MFSEKITVRQIRVIFVQQTLRLGPKDLLRTFRYTFMCMALNRFVSRNDRFQISSGPWTGFLVENGTQRKGAAVRGDWSEPNVPKERGRGWIVVKSRDGMRFGDLKQKVNEKVDENKDLSFSLQVLPTVHVMLQAEFGNRCFQTPFCWVKASSRSRNEKRFKYLYIVTSIQTIVVIWYKLTFLPLSLCYLW